MKKIVPAIIKEAHAFVGLKPRRGHGIVRHAAKLACIHGSFALIFADFVLGAALGIVAVRQLCEACHADKMAALLGGAAVYLDAA